jgi:hypothetical protein
VLRLRVLPAAVVAGIAALCVSGSAVGAGETFTVNFGSTSGTIAHYGGGLLNAINNATITRSNNSYDDLNGLSPYLWRGGLPGGAPNTPSYDYFDVPGRISDLGATQVEVIPDSYMNEYSGYSFYNLCNTIASQAVAAGLHPTYDLLNEPDIADPAGGSTSWLSSSTTDWDNCYDGVKAADSSATIAGPSISSPNISNVEQFLLNQKAKGKLPNVVTWHFESHDSFESDVAAVHSYMTAHGMSDREISVNEVLDPSQAERTGETVGYFAVSERSGAPVTHACWNEVGAPPYNTCEFPMLDGLMDQYGNRRGEWYAYHDLAEMSGSRVSTTSSNISNVDGLASKNTSSATIMVGALDPFTAGSMSVSLTNLSSLSFLGTSSGSLRTVIERLPAGQTPASQYMIDDSVHTYTGNTLTLSVSLAQYEAARITILPAPTAFNDAYVRPAVTIAARKSDNHIYDDEWDLTNSSGSGAWSGWLDRGVTTSASPAMVTSSNNTLSIYYKDSSGALAQIWNAGYGWSSPYGLGGPTSSTFSGDPAGAALSYGREMVAVTGTDGQIYYRWYNGSAWSAWTSITASSSDPGLASQGPDSANLFYMDSSGALEMRSWTSSGGWGSATSLGGPTGGTFTGSPAAISWGMGHLTIAVRGTDNALWIRTYADGAWGSWTSLGETLTGSPAIESTGPGGLGIYYAGTSGELYEVWTTTSTWSSPYDLGTTIVGRPGVTG